MKIYTMIIEKIKPDGTTDRNSRKPHKHATQGHAPNGWRCVAVSGYYEKEGKR